MQHNDKYIEVGVEYDEIEDGWRDKGVEYYWAVSPSPDKASYRPAASEEELELESMGTPYWRISGILPVYTLRDVEGYRKILDEIEQSLLE